MKKEVGNKNFPVWILGDSEPSNFSTVLDEPFDSRHPARHNIITPIFDVIQERVYLEAGYRFNHREIYIRNAVQNPNVKPKDSDLNWGPELNAEIEDYRTHLKQFKPSIVLSFGAFAFEFARRAMSEENKKQNTWDTKHLGEEFTKRTKSYEYSKTNVFPLLHVTIARGKFMESHEYFSGKAKSNYFEHTGEILTQKLLELGKEKSIWLAKSR